MRGLPLIAFLCGLLACTEPGSREIARGNALAAELKLDDAAEAYRTASRSAPNKARPRELLGHVLSDMGDPAAARTAYVDAIRVEPNAATEARIGLARLDAEENRVEDGLRQIDAVLAQQPKNLYALLSRSTLSLRRAAAGDVERALQDTETALTVDEKNPAVLYTRGCALLAAKDFDKATEMFGVLERTQPNSPLPAYGRARIAGARAEKPSALSNLALAKTKALALPNGWRGEDVKRDPAFTQWKDDPEFLRVVGN